MRVMTCGLTRGILVTAVGTGARLSWQEVSESGTETPWDMPRGQVVGGETGVCSPPLGGLARKEVHGGCSVAHVAPCDIIALRVFLSCPELALQWSLAYSDWCWCWPGEESSGGDMSSISRSCRRSSGLNQPNCRTVVTLPNQCLRLAERCSPSKESCWGGAIFTTTRGTSLDDTAAATAAML